jgi:4-oxalocrotonate tautomerase
MPFVHIHILEGRPKEQHRELIRQVTDVVSKVLDSPKDRIRVAITEVSPDSWGIGGVPASEVRRAEIETRAEAVAKQKAAGVG